MHQNHPIPAENPILSAPELEKHPTLDRPNSREFPRGTFPKGCWFFDGVTIFVDAFFILGMPFLDLGTQCPINIFPLLFGAR